MIVGFKRRHFLTVAAFQTLNCLVNYFQGMILQTLGHLVSIQWAIFTKGSLQLDSGLVELYITWDKM